MAGGELADALQLGAAIEHHEMLGERVLPFAIALAVTTVGQWVYLRFLPRRRWLTIVVAVLVIAAGLGAAVQVALAGDAGAHMVWGSVVQNP